MLILLISLLNVKMTLVEDNYPRVCTIEWCYLAWAVYCGRKMGVTKFAQFWDS